MTVTIRKWPKGHEPNRTHACELPSAHSYPYGTQISCDDCGQWWRRRGAEVPIWWRMRKRDRYPGVSR